FAHRNEVYHWSHRCCLRNHFCRPVNPTGPASGSAETPTQTLIDGSSKSTEASSEATPSSHDSSVGNDALRCSSKCLDVYSPVLGDDGIMYPRYCAIELAKCE
ncbi:hypothetical protein F443_14847, partial [Phytophthora nicotianae P1569]